MKDKNIKIRLIQWVELILETQIFFKNRGIDYFDKEYDILEKLKNDIYEINITKKEFEDIEENTIKLFDELNRFIPNLFKFKCILN